MSLEIDRWDPKWWGKCSRCNVVRERGQLGADGVCSDRAACDRLRELKPVNAHRTFIGPRRIASHPVPMGVLAPPEFLQATMGRA